MNNSYNSQGWCQGYSYPQSQYNNNTTTNIIRVTSLEEAVMRTTARNSDMVYFDQDRDVFYRVRVDWDGKKSWAEFQFTLPAQADTTPLTREELKPILTRLETLEAKFKEVPEDGKSNG